ncbi:hypothetical protein CR970_00435 [Candidatus Saccharibacteria bacterium]|nr:MAG: hypothetical protein CR970_00435 [Candidatus Saccharibacteria bacterium]
MTESTGNLGEGKSAKQPKAKAAKKITITEHIDDASEVSDVELSAEVDNQAAAAAAGRDGSAADDNDKTKKGELDQEAGAPEVPSKQQIAVSFVDADDQDHSDQGTEQQEAVSGVPGPPDLPIDHQPETVAPEPVAASPLAVCRDAIRKPAATGGAGRRAMALGSGVLRFGDISPAAGTAVRLATDIEEPVEDSGTARAVDDIVARESDDLLAAEDARRGSEFSPVPARRHRRGNPLWAFLRKPAVVWSVLVVLVLGGIGVAAVPSSRYSVLNAVGVRVGASVKILDQSTQQPLKGVHVKIAGVTVDTDAEGMATFSGLPLGKTIMTIEKRAFAPVLETRVLGWGSNPLGDRQVNPIGSQYTFTVNDYLSGAPIEVASVNAGDADANADEQGVAKLTVDHSTADTIEATVQAPGYRDEPVTITADTRDAVAVRMVPDKKHVFVSQRAGKYDVYTIDIDGANEKLVLEGTGRERDDIAISIHPSDGFAAVVSTRDGKHNDDGYLLSTLSVINVGSGDVASVAQSESIKIIGWSGSRLVYLQVAAGASATNPSRQRLMSYDFLANDSKQLASANYFNAVGVAGQHVFYAPSSNYQASAVNGLFRVQPDGNELQTVISGETWTIIRTDYNTLAINAAGKWYDFHLDATAATEVEAQPSDTKSKHYANSPDGSRSIRVEERDGKGVLLLRDNEDGTEKPLISRSGLSKPIRWLTNSVVVYRIDTDQENADYAFSIEGGDPIKVRDVTHTNSVDRWYYY